MLVHPGENDALADAVDVTAQWIGVDIGQRQTAVRTRRVLELSRRYLGQHQRLRPITSRDGFRLTGLLSEITPG